MRHRERMGVVMGKKSRNGVREREKGVMGSESVRESGGY